MSAAERPRIDIHTHLAPHLAPGAAQDFDVDEVDGFYVVEGHRIGPPGLYATERMLSWMDSVSLDRAWVSVPPPFFRQGFDGARIRQWVTAINDGLIERVSSASQLDVLAYLPLDEPDVAEAELDRLASAGTVLGWVGSAGGGSLALDDPSLARVWSRVARSGRPIMLHPGSSPDRRLDPHYLANLLGNPVETTLAAAQLVFGGVLADNPALRVALVHCGGAVPMLAGRWQRGLDTSRPGVEALTLGPRDAVRRFWVDALAHDPAAVDLAVAVIGEDKLVLGSDWPFPMGLDDPASGVAHLEGALRERIARDNVATLLGGVA